MLQIIEEPNNKKIYNDFLDIPDKRWFKAFNINKSIFYKKNDYLLMYIQEEEVKEIHYTNVFHNQKDWVFQLIDVVITYKAL